LGGLPGFPHPGGLDSAVNAPRHTYEYSNGDCDVFDLAAVYLYHIAKSHAFSDGNKRTAYVSAVVFLGMNGYNISLPRNVTSLAAATVAAADGQLGRDQLSQIMREMPRMHRRRRPPKRSPLLRRQPRRHCSRHKRLL
jgi:death-on-curing protein